MQSEAADFASGADAGRHRPVNVVRRSTDGAATWRTKETHSSSLIRAYMTSSTKPEVLNISH